MMDNHCYYGVFEARSDRKWKSVEELFYQDEYYNLAMQPINHIWVKMVKNVLKGTA